MYECPFDASENPAFKTLNIALPMTFEPSALPSYPFIHPPRRLPPPRRRLHL